MVQNTIFARTCSSSKSTAARLYSRLMVPFQSVLLKGKPATGQVGGRASVSRLRNRRRGIITDDVAVVHAPLLKPTMLEDGWPILAGCGGIVVASRNAAEAIRNASQRERSPAVSELMRLP